MSQPQDKLSLILLQLLSKSKDPLWLKILYRYDCENVVITGSTIADVTFDIRDGDNFELAAVDWPQTNSALCPYVVTLTVTR